MIITRFAPSPTGLLHLGHAYSALMVYESIQDGGVFLLRIEDIDHGRCRPEYEAAILEDLHWLGIRWQKPLRRQSEQMADYRQALAQLTGQGILYPCFCSRTEMATERSRLGVSKSGPDGPLYSGYCRNLDSARKGELLARKKPFALRLDMGQAIARVGQLTWTDRHQGLIVASPEIFGDVVLARKDVPTSYHLSATLDDHLQGVNLVIRGQDLFFATHIHRLLQALLGLSTPTYQHHRLLLDDDGQKFAKRNRSLTLQELRSNGVTAEQIRQRVFP
jgi:glutamyl-Q tRNA(Asp) synthetase